MSSEKSETSKTKMTDNNSMAVPRDKLINTAVEFLMSPAVRDSSLEMKIAFLKKKGLSENEVNIAVSRAEENMKQIVPVPYNPPQAASMAVVPYYPITPWSRVRDFMNTVVLVGGFMYGVYWAYKNIIFPYLFGKNHRKSIDRRLDELDASISNSVTEINNNITKLSSSIENSEKKNDSINKQIEELKSEVSSLKKLLLNRKQFPATSPVAGPVSIPHWQMVAAKEVQEEEGNGSGTNGSDSSLEMIK